MSTTVPEIGRDACTPYNHFDAPKIEDCTLLFYPDSDEKKWIPKFQTIQQWQDFCRLPLSKQQKQDILSKEEETNKFFSK